MCFDWLVKLKQTCNGIVGNDNSKVCVLVYSKQWTKIKTNRITTNKQQKSLKTPHG